MLEIIDPETGNKVLKVELLDGEKQYPFGFYFNALDEGDVWLSALEAEKLYDWLGEQFGPKNLINE